MSVVPKGTPRREAYRYVWEGVYARTNGGLTKADLALNAQGRIVSKAMQVNGQRRWQNMSASERRKFGHGSDHPRSSRRPTPLAQLQARLALPPRRPTTLCTDTPVGTVCTRVSQKTKKPSARQCRTKVAQNLVEHTQRPVGPRCRRVAAKALLEDSSSSSSDDDSDSSSSSSDEEEDETPPSSEERRRRSNPTEFWLSQ